MPIRSSSLAAIALLVAGGCARHHDDAATVPGPAPQPVPAVAMATDTTGLPVGPTVTPGGSEVREYRGTYSTSFEASWFEACGRPSGDRLWWVTLTEEARLQRDSLVKALPVRPTAGLAVQVRATLSPTMASGAGQMGRGSRYMLITRFLSLRPATGDASPCGNSA